MSQNDPLMVLLMFGASIYLGKLWWHDWMHWRVHQMTLKNAFPGATSCSWFAVFIAIAGALIILAVETGGEYALGISTSQSNITVLFLAAMLAAGFMEELIFRGYLVITNKGSAWLIGSILLFSI